MAFINPSDADDLNRNEKSKLETQEEGTDEDSGSESSVSEQEWRLERRRAQRHSAKREAHLLFIASPLEVASGHQSHKLMGYTRDISEMGLSLIVTSTHVSDYNLGGVDTLLRIKLSLPSGVAEMDVKVVRSEWLDDDDPRQGKFLGVSITGLSDEDRRRYSDYLTTLG